MSHQVNDSTGPWLGLRLACCLVCSLACCLVCPGSALGLEPAVVELACPQLSEEQAAEVEARARASLLVSLVNASHVHLACAPGLATITVETAAERVTEQRALHEADTRDVLLAALELALAQLSQRPSPSDSPPADLQQPAPALPSPPAAAPPVESSRASPPQPLPNATRHVDQRGTASMGSSERAWTAELFLLGEVESWHGTPAFGGTLGAGYGARGLAATLAFGALAADPPSDSFGASELHAALGLMYQPPWSLGIRAQVSVGGSLLLVRPRADIRPRGSTSVAAATSELQLSRPLRLGSWALVPALGVRLFADDRRVTLDDDPRLVIGKLAPRAALGVLHRFE